MENTNDNIIIPRIAFERMQAKDERNDMWRNIIIILLIILLVASNAFWVYEWSQYDYYSEEINVDSADGGNANYIGDDGNIYNDSTVQDPEE